MTRSETLTGQLRYLPLTVTGSLDGFRLSFGGGETVADFKTPDAAFRAQRAAEVATAALLSRVFH